jgi:hypothetical protein
MRDIALGQYGRLTFEGDRWWASEVGTPVGPVGVQVVPCLAARAPVDPASVDLDGVASRVVAVLQRIADIDREARAYLATEAPEDVEYAGELVMPSLLVDTDEPHGSFVIFYHGSDETDEMLYGVEFQGFCPLALLIGD